MPLIAVTSLHSRNAARYRDAVERVGARVKVLTPKNGATAQEIPKRASGLLLTGGPDNDPVNYSEEPAPNTELDLYSELDQLEHTLLGHALFLDMPVLAICRGMQLLNVTFGGKLVQHISNHCSQSKDEEWNSSYHSIYLSPGSKLAAILGMGGFFRVNSLHHQGLREAQKASRLLASAYSLEDGLIEGLESPEHDWVVGVQCHPELQEEVPKVFANLFLAFVERAERYDTKMPKER